MLETRRHSVDLPISKTLVALTRVRSLRDPTTNSISKFATSADNLNRETYSCSNNDNVSFLRKTSFENGHYGNHGFGSDGELECRRNVAPELVVRNGFCGSGSVEQPGELKYYEKEARTIISNESNMAAGRVEHREGAGGRADEMGFRRSSRQKQVEEPALSMESKHGKMFKSTMKPVEDRAISSSSSAVECNGDSILCGVSDVHSPRGSDSLIENDGVDLMGSYRGGMCCCWSRTERLQDRLFPHLCRCNPSVSGQGNCWKKMAFGSSSNSRSPSTVLPSDTEVLPLLRSGGTNVGRFRANRRRGCFRSPRKYLFEDLDENENENSQCSGSYKLNSMLGSGSRKLALHSDGPRTLSQKFRPRSFDELVGQSMVALSLVNAVLKGKIAPVYLFQGPHGTGKTCATRIFTAAMNCLSFKERRPCGFCRECMLFFSGRSRDVKEVDAAKTNSSDKVKALLKRGALTPVASRFRVIIVDGCHLLQREAWAAILNSLEELPRHAVFIMVTADPDKLPRAAVSRCQRYHFSKIKEADIVGKLNKICVEENLDCDKAALEYIAIKSNGSLRDAETMLEQLSLLGQRITVSLIYEFIGSVSDDELLDLLDLALSADTSSTVRRARELMRYRVDPMALISQLANLIMDILAGRCQLGNLTGRRNFFGRNALTEAELQKLRHALKILSETEKQLKSSKNQSTWLMAALLQFSVGESSSPPDDPRACQDTSELRENGFCSTTLTMDSSKDPLNGVCNNNKFCWLGPQNDTAGKLDAIWTRTVAKCQSHALKDFLLKEGKLSSICVDQGLAIIELEFCHPDHVSRAEKSWKNIATSLQHVLGCNIEIRINLTSSSATSKNDKVKRSKMISTTIDSDAHAHNSGSHSEGITEREKYSFCGYRCFPFVQKAGSGQLQRTVCFHPEDTTIATATSNIEMNAQGTLRDDLPNGEELENGSLKEVGDPGLRYLGLSELENQPSCFSKTMKLQRWLRPSDLAHRISLRIQAHEKDGSSIPRETTHGMLSCADDAYVLFSSANQQTSCRNSSEDQDLSCKLPRPNLKLHCWRTPKFPLRKAWKQRRRQQQRRCRFLGRILPCTTVKEA